MGFPSSGFNLQRAISSRMNAFLGGTKLEKKASDESPSTAQFSRTDRRRFTVAASTHRGDSNRPLNSETRPKTIYIDYFSDTASQSRPAQTTSSSSSKNASGQAVHERDFSLSESEAALVLSSASSARNRRISERLIGVQNAKEIRDTPVNWVSISKRVNNNDQVVNNVDNDTGNNEERCDAKNRDEVNHVRDIVKDLEPVPSGWQDCYHLKPEVVVPPVEFRDWYIIDDVVIPPPWGYWNETGDKSNQHTGDNTETHCEIGELARSLRKGKQMKKTKGNKSKGASILRNEIDEVTASFDHSDSGFCERASAEDISLSSSAEERKAPFNDVSRNSTSVSLSDSFESASTSYMMAGGDRYIDKCYNPAFV